MAAPSATLNLNDILNQENYMLKMKYLNLATNS